MEIHEITANSSFGEGQAVAALYGNTFNISPIVHEVMTGRGLIRFFVLYHGCQLAGGATLKSPETAFPIGDDVGPIAWVISDVLVRSDMRGKGFGLELIKHLEDAAVRAGCRILYLYTEQGNDPAIALYQKAGFERLRDQSGNVVLCKLVR